MIFNKKATGLKKTIYIVLAASFFILGFFSHRFKNSLKQYLKEKKSSENIFLFDQIDPDFLKVDVNALVSLKKPTDVEKVRSKLRKYIWRQNENFEALGELEIVDRIEDSSYHKINDLESLQAWKSRMEFGFESVAYLFIPKQPNRNLIIYHSGHYEDGFHPALSSIQYWISAGFAVLAVALPLTGMNQGAGHLVDVSGQGPFFMKIHNHLQLLEAPTFSPLKIFMEPLRRFVNFAIQKNHFDQIFMAGLSGGGWATTLYAALDPRILRSYPVAGSLPLFLKSKGRLGELGDYEQTDAGFYGIANYLDLYIMGAVGSGRRQLQILNQYDPCCFPGLRAQVYVDELKKRLQKMGSGSFDLFVDSTHRDHKISARALELITKDMLQAD